MLGQIRKAGQFLADKDRQYASAIAKNIDPSKQPLREMTQAVPLADIFGQGNTGESQVEKLVGLGMDVGVASANMASRYLLPAGGVTLAGKGLYDLATQFGNAADYPEQQTLTLS